MSESGPGEITILLHRWRDGDRTARDKVFELLLPDLRKIARNCFRGERKGHTLQPTALINEAFLRLAKTKKIEFKDRGHFFALSACAMRHHLIDNARRKGTVMFQPFGDVSEIVGTRPISLDMTVALNTLLDELSEQSAQRCTVVELKFFLGCTDQEIADAMGLTLHTVQRQWFRARRWLYERLDTDASCQAASSTSG